MASATKISPQTFASDVPPGMAKHSVFRQLTFDESRDVDHPHVTALNF